MYSVKIPIQSHILCDFSCALATAKCNVQKLLFYNFYGLDKISDLSYISRFRIIKKWTQTRKNLTCQKVNAFCCLWTRSICLTVFEKKFLLSSKKMWDLRREEHSLLIFVITSFLFCQILLPHLYANCLLLIHLSSWLFSENVEMLWCDKLYSIVKDVHFCRIFSIFGSIMPNFLKLGQLQNFLKLHLS